MHVSMEERVENYFQIEMQNFKEPLHSLIKAFRAYFLNPRDSVYSEVGDCWIRLP